MRFRIGAAVIFACGGIAAAQTLPGTPVDVPKQSYEMPGKPVGQPSVQPVGTQLPKVGNQLPRTGTSPGQPGGVNSPFGGGAGWPTVDPALVVAPYPGDKKPAADFWDRLQDRWAKLFAPPPRPPSVYVPGITRRNRERREAREMDLERRWRD